MEADEVAAERRRGVADEQPDDVDGQKAATAGDVRETEADRAGGDGRDRRELDGE